MSRPSRIEQLSDPSVILCDKNVVHLNAVRAAQRAIPQTDELGHISALFAALSDPTRLRIISALNASELCVCDIAAVLGLTESAVSHQLRQLKRLGLVRSRRDGRMSIYSLDDDHVASLYAQARDHVSHQQSRS